MLDVALLESAGAECIAIPCNTAHLCHDRLSRASSVPILNMVDEAVGLALGDTRRAGSACCARTARCATACTRARACAGASRRCIRRRRARPRSWSPSTGTSSGESRAAGDRGGVPRRQARRGRRRDPRLHRAFGLQVPPRRPVRLRRFARRPGARIDRLGREAIPGRVRAKGPGPSEAAPAKRDRAERERPGRNGIGPSEAGLGWPKRAWAERGGLGLQNGHGLSEAGSG